VRISVITAGGRLATGHPTGSARCAGSGCTGRSTRPPIQMPRPAMPSAPRRPMSIARGRTIVVRSSCRRAEPVGPFQPSRSMRVSASRSLPRSRSTLVAVAPRCRVLLVGRLPWSLPVSFGHRKTLLTGNSRHDDGRVRAGQRRRRAERHRCVIGFRRRGDVLPRNRHRACGVHRSWARSPSSVLLLRLATLRAPVHQRKVHHERHHHLRLVAPYLERPLNQREMSSRSSTSST